MIRPGTIEEAWHVLQAIPEFDQRRSLAQRLLEVQEAWAAEHGFAAVTVKSMNRYPSMLRLLIRNGYRIRAGEQFGDPASERIHFIKPLSWNAS